MEPSMVLAHFLDPARAVLTLAGIFLWRSPWIILVAGGLSAATCESVLAGAGALRFWGEGILAGSMASVLQAFLLYLIVQTLRERRAPGTKTNA
jgi:hypothetical protein